MQTSKEGALRVEIPTTEARVERVVAHQIPKQYTVFIIKVGYQQKEWTIERRFSDFLTLHRSLKLKFPMVVSMFATNFPKKYILPLKTMDPKTIEERRVFFESYLRALVELSPRPGDVNAFLNFDPKEHNKEESLTLDDFEVLETLGSGAFGKVLLVRKLGSDDLFAMKVLKKDEVKRRNQVAHTLTERAVMESISHPFIVPLCYSFQSRTRLFMVSEFCPGGELFYHLREARSFDEEAVKFYITEVLMALEHLHSQGIVYRDLKPENVLLDAEGHVRVTDFGLSKTNVTYSSGAKTYCGTPEYLAPEMILVKRENAEAYGFSVDWWSLGTFAFELFCGNPPFQDRNVKVMTERILTERVRFPPTHVPTMAFRDFVLSLLQRDPANRLGVVKNVRDHLWFETIIWDDVLQKKYKPPVVPHIDPQYITVNFDPQDSQIMDDVKVSSMSKVSSQSTNPQLQQQQQQSVRRQLLRFVPKAVARAVNVMEMPTNGEGEVEDELTAMFKSFAFEKGEEEVAERQIPMQHLSSTMDSLRLSGRYQSLGADVELSGLQDARISQLQHSSISEVSMSRSTAASTLQEDFDALWGEDDVSIIAEEEE